jgi:hypothetical protein
MGSERLGREYSAVRCLGWGRGCLQRLSDDKHGGVRGGAGVVKQWRRKKRGRSTVGCSLYSRQKWWNEGDAVAKPWEGKWRWSPWLGRRWHGLGADVWVVRLTSGPQAVSQFSKLSKLVETCKVEKAALSSCKTSQFLHEASLEYHAQRFRLC